MATLDVKGREIEYTICNDKVSVNISDTKVMIPIEKITGKPLDEKNLTKQALRSYLENSRYFKSSLKK
jgi:hypothetical protein